MSYTFICLQCGRKWKCSEPPIEDICGFCELDNRPTMTIEELDEIMKTRSKHVLAKGRA